MSKRKATPAPKRPTAKCFTQQLTEAIIERNEARAEVRTLQAELADARKNVADWCAQAQEWRMHFERMSAQVRPTPNLPEVRRAVFPEFTGALQVFAHAQA